MLLFGLIDKAKILKCCNKQTVVEIFSERVVTAKVVFGTLCYENSGGLHTNIQN